MKSFFTKILLLCGLLTALPLFAQTINPNQIRPSTTNNDVLTTIGGVTVWHAGATGGCTVSGPAGYFIYWDGTTCNSAYIDYNQTYSDTITVATPDNGTGSNIELDAPFVSGSTSSGIITLNPGNVKNVGSAIGNSGVWIYGSDEDNAINLIGFGHTIIMSDAIDICGDADLGSLPKPDCPSGSSTATVFSIHGNTNIKSDLGTAGLYIDIGSGIQNFGWMQQGIEENDSGTTSLDFDSSVQQFDATAGNVTVDLPPITTGIATNSGETYTIIKEDSSANTVTIVPNGSDTINGAANYVLTARYQSVTLYSNGENDLGLKQWNIQAITTSNANGLVSFQGRTTPNATLIVADVNGLGTISNNTTGNALSSTTTSSIASLIAAGTNIGIAGSGTTVSPYVISSASSFSSNYITLSSLGCPQHADLMLGTGTLADSCINAACASATLTNPITLVQDGTSIISNIHCPANGGWSIIGLGGGLSTIPITSCTITSNVATFVTATNTLTAGQGLIVGGFGSGCAALNGVSDQGVQVVVNSSGLSSTGFTANFTTANVATEVETATASWLTGTGFYQQSGATGAMISNGVITCADPGTIPPSRGANVIIRDLVLNPNSQGNSGFCSGLDFANLNNIYIDNMLIFNNSHFAIRFDNVGNVVIHATKIFPYAPGVVLSLSTPAFSDGLHFDGPANDIQIDDYQYHGSDDGIALNAREGYCGPISRVQVTNYEVINANDVIRAYNNSVVCANGLSPLIDQIGLTNVHGDVYKGLGYLGDNIGTHTLTLNPAITNFTWTNSHVYSPQGFLVYDNLGEIHFDVDWELTASGAFPNWILFGENQIHVQTLDMGHSTQILTAANHNFAPITSNADGSACGLIDTLQVNGYSVKSNPVASYGPIPYLFNFGGGCGSLTHLVVLGYDQTNINALANYAGGGVGTIQQPNYLPASIRNGLLVSYPANEGRGTAFYNGGSDYTNTATFNGTWAAAAGFQGNVATYNGSSQYAIVGSSTSTNFDGTAPFSGCSWFNVPALSGDQWIFANADISLGAIPGYGIEVYGTTGLRFVLINTFGSNAIDVNTSSGTPVSVNLPHLACVSYDGSKTAAGVSIYLDGALQPNTVVTNNLTGSTVSPVSLTLGCLPSVSGCGTGNLDGVIGHTNIWNRLLSPAEVLALFKAAPNAL
jgi:hypothetical protein